MNIARLYETLNKFVPDFEKLDSKESIRYQQILEELLKLEYEKFCKIIDLVANGLIDITMLATEVPVKETEYLQGIPKANNIPSKSEAAQTLASRLMQKIKNPEGNVEAFFSGSDQVSAIQQKVSDMDDQTKTHAENLMVSAKPYIRSSNADHNDQVSIITYKEYKEKYPDGDLFKYKKYIQRSLMFKGLK